MTANNKKGCLPTSTSEPGGSGLDAWDRPGTSKLPCQPAWWSGPLGLGEIGLEDINFKIKTCTVGIG